MKTRITELFGVKYPIVLAGMGYVSIPKLVAAVCNAGGLGIMSALTYDPQGLRAAIREIKTLTDKPFGVNVALIFPGGRDLAKVILEERVSVVNYALGRAPDLIKAVHGYGGRVIGTVAMEKHAIRAEQDGVDAIAVTGHEAGGHGGNVTSLVIIPRIRDVVKVPLIAAGGFCDGRGLAAALVLGSDAISMGTRFAATKESPLHDYYKQAIIKATIEDTLYSDRIDGIPSRVLRTKTSEEWVTKHRFFIVESMVNSLRFKRELKLSNWEFVRGVVGLKKAHGTTVGNLARIPVAIPALRSGIEHGDEDGIMPCGQNCGSIEDIPTCAELIQRIITEAQHAMAHAEAKISG